MGNSELIFTEPQNGAIFHLTHHRQALLFMGMGLGKTASVLMALRMLMVDGASTGALVVAPLRVVNLTWPAEVKKWWMFRDFRVANLRTPEGWRQLEEGSAHIYLINYDMLQKFQERYLKGRRKEQYAFDTVVWDEITKAKNHKSKRINAVRKYFHKYCDRHWGLTGTPSPESLMDLFAQARLVDDGQCLGPSFGAFRNAYFRATDYMEYNWVPREGAREQIYERLSPLALTLRSSDWLDIPDVVEEDIEVALPKEAKAVYHEMQTELYTEIDSEGIEAVNSAVLVNKLLQCTSGAVYFERYNEERDMVLKGVSQLHTAKIDALEKLYRRINRPLLVACSFQHEQDRIRRAFPRDAVLFQNATTPQAQTALAEKWNRGDIRMLVAHPASIGHGLNLQGGGSDICWFSLTWSRELYDQMNARLARTGQKDITNVYRLICPGTVDDAVAEALRAKDSEQSALLEALVALRKLF